jgi:hypothetical protein
VSSHALAAGGPQPVRSLAPQPRRRRPTGRKSKDERDAEVRLRGDATSSLGDATSSLGDATSSLGDATSSLGDAQSSLGDATSSLGDAESSLGE